MSLRTFVWETLFPKFQVSSRGAKARSTANRRQLRWGSFERLEPRWALDADTEWAPTFSISGGGGSESGGYAVVEISCSGQEDTVTVDYWTESGSASGSDFSSASGTLTFEVGQSPIFITIGIVDDTDTEESESFSVVLSSGGSASVSIDANDLPPSIDVSASFADGAWTISGSVSDPDGDPAGCTVQFGGVLATYGLSATVQSDGTFSVTAELEGLEAGTATASTIDGDGIASNTAECSVGIPQGSISIGSASVRETSGYAVLTVTCSGHAQTVTVAYATADGCAQAGSDYDSASGMLTFEVGQTEQTITIGIINDSDAEESEDFCVELSSAVGATVCGQGGVSIASSDHPPVIDGFSVVQNDYIHWTVSGHVSDPDENCTGFAIAFGGVLGCENLSATVGGDGSFSINFETYYLQAGTATAQTTDTEGLASNEAFDVVVYV